MPKIIPIKDLKNTSEIPICATRRRDQSMLLKMVMVTW